MSNLAIQYGVFFLAQLALSWHCIGMCGPFVIAVAGRDRKRAVSRQLVYHSGKATTYLFLGLLAAMLGRAVDRHASEIFSIQSVMSWVAGGVLVLVALQLLGVFRHVPGLNRVISGERWAAVCGRFDPSSSLGAALALGLVNGFMPCPLVVGALAMAISAPSILAGMGYMLALAVATFPALMLLAMGASWIRGVLNLRSVRITGAVILLMSAVAILRPSPLIHTLMGHDHSQQSAGEEQMGHCEHHPQQP